MRRRPALLLVAIAAGVVAPAVHRWQHATEAVAARSAHAAAGHHHHGAFVTHGVEWTPACDRPVALDELTCVLCKALHAGDLPAATALFAPPSPLEAFGAPAQVVVRWHAGISRVRGPPHSIA